MLETMAARMLVRLLAFGAAAVVLQACGASDGMTEPAEGGQTGSLLPPCLLDSAEPYVVPEGDTALAQQMQTALSEAVLTDASGQLIATQVTQSNNTTIVRTATVLTTGSYQITTTCPADNRVVTREITVVEAAPLPTEFGELAVTTSNPRPLCSEWEVVDFSWTPPADFLPYLNLTELSVAAGTNELGAIPLAEPLKAAPDGAVHLSIPLCNGSVPGCIHATGSHRLTAHIAGETQTWTSSEIDLDGLCRADTPDSAQCDISRTDNGRLPFGWLCLSAAMWLGRRSRQHSERILKALQHRVGSVG